MARLRLDSTAAADENDIPDPAAGERADLTHSLSAIAQDMERSQKMAITGFCDLWAQEATNENSLHAPALLAALPATLGQKLEDLLTDHLTTDCRRHLRFFRDDPWWHMPFLDMLGVFGLQGVQSRSMLQAMRDFQSFFPTPDHAMASMREQSKARRGSSRTSNRNRNRPWAPEDAFRVLESARSRAAATHYSHAANSTAHAAALDTADLLTPTHTLPAAPLSSTVSPAPDTVLSGNSSATIATPIRASSATKSPSVELGRKDHELELSAIKAGNDSLLSVFDDNTLHLGDSVLNDTTSQFGNDFSAGASFGGEDSDDEPTGGDNSSSTNLDNDSTLHNSLVDCAGAPEGDVSGRTAVFLECLLARLHIPRSSTPRTSSLHVQEAEEEDMRKRGLQELLLKDAPPAKRTCTASEEPMTKEQDKADCEGFLRALAPSSHLLRGDKGTVLTKIHEHLDEHTAWEDQTRSEDCPLWMTAFVEPDTDTWPTLLVILAHGPLISTLYTYHCSPKQDDGVVTTYVDQLCQSLLEDLGTKLDRKVNHDPLSADKELDNDLSLPLAAQMLVHGKAQTCSCPEVWLVAADILSASDSNKYVQGVIGTIRDIVSELPTPSAGKGTIKDGLDALSGSLTMYREAVASTGSIVTDCSFVRKTIEKALELNANLFSQQMSAYTTAWRTGESSEARQAIKKAAEDLKVEEAKRSTGLKGVVTGLHVISSTASEVQAECQAKVNGIAEELRSYHATIAKMLDG